MGFLVTAVQSRSSEDFSAALQGVRLLGDVRRSGIWWWSFVFFLHFKELDHALVSHHEYSLAAYAGDGTWKLSLYGPNEKPFFLWFDASLATDGGVLKARSIYEGKPLKLARQFGMTAEDLKVFGTKTFEDAVAHLLGMQTSAILDAFHRFRIPCDPVTTRGILLNPTDDELDSELGNLPRLLEEIGIRGLLE